MNLGEHPPAHLVNTLRARAPVDCSPVMALASGPLDGLSAQRQFCEPGEAFVERLGTQHPRGRGSHGPSAAGLPDDPADPPALDAGAAPFGQARSTTALTIA